MSQHPVRSAPSHRASRLGREHDVLVAAREAPGWFNLIISRLLKKHASHVSQRCLSRRARRGWSTAINSQLDPTAVAGKPKKLVRRPRGGSRSMGTSANWVCFAAEALRAHDRPSATSIEATTSCTFHTRRRAEFGQSHGPGPLKVKWVCFAKRLAGTGIGTIGKGEPPIWRRIQCVLNAIRRSNS